MPKFRKKPVVIEAMQYTPESCLAIHEWMEIEHFSGGAGNPCEWMAIETLEGTMEAHVGDWIIKGVKGEFYPCKPDIFAATYEPVE